MELLGAIVIFIVISGLVMFLAPILSNLGVPKKYQYSEDMVPKPIDEGALCKERHTWINAAMLDESKELVETNLCSTCGFLPSKDLMVSQKGVDTILKSNREREMGLAIQEEFVSSEEAQMKELFAEELKNGLDINKLWGVYTAGSSSYSRYAFFKMARLEEMEKPKEPENV